MDNKIFISTACLKGDKSYERVLNTFVDNDIFNIELTGVHPHTSKTSLEKIIRKFQKKKVNFTFHNYFPPPKKPIVLNFLTRNKDLQAKCKKIIKESISLAKKLNIYTVIKDLYLLKKILKDEELTFPKHFKDFKILINKKNFNRIKCINLPFDAVLKALK